MKNAPGLALIELLVAMVVMGLIIFGLGTYYRVASLRTLGARGQTTAAQLAEMRLEQLRSRPFSWVTQANVNGSFNFASGNANCPGTTDTEVLNDTGACYDDAADIGPRYTRVTTVTTSYSGQTRLTAVKVLVKWQQDGLTCDLVSPAEGNTQCLVFNTVLVNFP